MRFDDSDMIDEALKRFGFRGHEAELIAANENRVYKIKNEPFVLRIHEEAPGFSPICRDRLFEGELLWHLTKMEMPVPCPVMSLAKNFEEELAPGVSATVLAWVEGESFDSLWSDADIPEHIAFEAGQELAKLHKEGTRSCLPPAKRHYGKALIPKIVSAIAEGEASGAILKEETGLIGTALEKAESFMEIAEAETGICPIHGDLSGGNIIWNEKLKKAGFIDFSMSGTGSLYADLGSFFANFTRENVQNSFLEGYENAWGRCFSKELINAYRILFVALFIAMRRQSAKDWPWFHEYIRKNFEKSV